MINKRTKRNNNKEDLLGKWTNEIERTINTKDKIVKCKELNRKWNEWDGMKEIRKTAL